MNRIVVIQEEELQTLIRTAVADATSAPSAISDDRLLTSEEIAEFLSVSARSISAMVRRDGLPFAGRLGRSYRFRRSAVAAWIEDRASAPRKHSTVHVARLRLRTAG